MERGGVFLFDEVDASNPMAVNTANAALDNGILDGPDGMIKRHPDFHFIAAANTYGTGATQDYVGRNPLDAATLNRFAFIDIDYDEDLELAMTKDAHGKEYASWVQLVQTTRQIARDLQLRHIISPRASRDGAALLKAGLKQDFVFNATVIKGLDKDSAIKLTKKTGDKLEQDLETITTQHKEVQTDRITGIMADLAEASASLQGAKKIVISMEECQKLLESTTEVAAKIQAAHEAVDTTQATVNQVEAIKSSLEEFTNDAKILKRAVKIVEEARELDGLSEDFAKTKAFIESFSGNRENAQRFLDAVDELSQRVQSTTGFKKGILNLIAGKPTDENILG